jgi:exonuclease SbcD
LLEVPADGQEAGREVEMKILHTSDWHLGAYVGPQCDDPYKRMANTMKCLDMLVETARRELPDIILIAGDIWHVAKTWNDRGNIELRIAADYIDKLKEIAFVVVLYGTPNHDSREMFNSLVRICGDDESNCCFFDEPDICTIHTKSGPIQVAGLPGFDKGHFRAQFPGIAAEDENRIFSQQLSSIVQGLSAQLDPNIPSVLMAHYTVAGCELDNGQNVFLQNDILLDPAALDNSGFDIVCLGHIHKAQRVESCSKPVYYAGSIDSFTFNDEEHDKGFYIHSIEDYGTAGNDGALCMHSPRFIETPAREFLTCNWPQDAIESYNEVGIEAFMYEPVKDKVVRILYTCDSETEKALDKKKLERDLYAAGAYYVSEIRPEKVTASVNREGMTEKLTVEDCLIRYLREKNYTIPEIVDAAYPIIEQAQASMPMGSSSGLFLPVEIDVHNYRSYADEKLSFEDIFFAMVNGRNGSGKSSLFMDAITDCLYEETREKELTGWIRSEEKSGSISFTFRLGDDTYRVTRTRQRSGKATLAIAKYEYRNTVDSEGAGWEDLSCQKLADTQQKIIELLGMDCDTFQSCVLIMQDRYGKFMEADKEMRMTVLANLLGLGVYEKLEDLTKEKLTGVNREIKSLKDEIEALELEVGNEYGLYTEKAQVEASIALTSDELTAAREDLSNYRAELARMSGYEEESANLQKDVNQKLTSLSGKKSKKAELEKNLAETRSFLENEQSILDKCSELEEAKLGIAAVDGKVKLLHDKQNQLLKLGQEKTRIQQQRKEIEQKLNFIARNLQDRKRLEQIVEGSTVEKDLEDMEVKAQKHRELENSYKEAIVRYDNYDSETNREFSYKKVKLDTLCKQVEMLNNSGCLDPEKAKCRFLISAQQAKDDAESLKSEIDRYLISRRGTAEELKKEVDRLKAELDRLDYYPEKHGALLQEVKRYRDAKDCLSKMAADAATADQLRNQDAGLAERLSSIEGEMQALDSEISELSGELNTYHELSAKVKELAKYEDMKMQLPMAKQYLVSTEEQVAQLAADIEDLEAAIRQVEDRREELRKLLASRIDKMSAATRIEATISDLERAMSLYNQEIGQINARLATIGTQKEKLEVKRNDLKSFAEKAAAYSILAEAFSQDGIPYQIIRDIVPELEAAANEILGRMTGGRMRLEFVTEKVLKSNKAKEIATLDIIIIDVDHGVLPYLSRSGGQKVRAALAVNFALANIKASRVGLQLGMMFVDEPPFLDADGVDAYCSTLEVIHNKYPDMRILAISHDENMKARFPQQLAVVVTENGSKVVKAA